MNDKRKEEYKMQRTHFKSGVYIILNKTNEKVYVGSAANIKDRLYNHKRELQKGKHINKHLQSAWNKYGEENFEFNVILYCSNKNRLIYEQEMIDKYLSLHLAYNIYPKAGSPLGSHHSPETITKQSNVRKQYWETHEKPIGGKNPFYNKKHTEETCNKIGSKNKGKLKGNQHAKGNKFNHTPEQIEKMKSCWTQEMREKAAERGKNKVPWNRGLKGTYHNKRGNGKIGSHHSIETKNKQSISRIEYLKNPENKEKLIEAVKKGWRTRKMNLNFK